MLRIKNRLPALMGEKRVKSVRQLSKATGIPYATLMNFYHEKYETFNGDLVVKLCQYFECDIADLIYLNKDVQAS